MRSHRIRAKQLAQMMRYAFRHPARIHEYQSRAVRLNELRETMINFFPNFVRHHRLERRFRDFSRQVQVPSMTDIDDGTIRIAIAIHGTSADKKPRDFFDRL